MSQYAPMNQNQYDPKLSGTLDRKSRALMLQFNCHAVATVQSFNSAELTVTATINYPKTFYRPDPVTGIISPISISYPVLVDCPVMLPQGGGFAVTCPIQQGDTCVILFNDRALDNWFKTGQILPLNSNRLHAFEDGMAFVGLRAATNPLNNYEAAAAVIQDPSGQIQVGVSSSKVRAKNGTTTLGAQIQNLITQLSALSGYVGTINAAAGNPVTPANIAAVTAQLNIIGIALGGLLE